MTGEACVVQFPHPGPEHVPESCEMAWNTGPHRRKFLTSPARIVDACGRTERDAKIVFWGEWEPPSRIVHQWRPERWKPTVVHEPYWISPGPPGERQNTDPWVFGPSFLYGNCKQLTPACRPSALQGLPAASVILFGSSLDGEFVLDTVFVVAEVVTRFRPVDDPVIGGAAFHECTVRSLAAGPNEHAAAQLTLYRGATPDNPAHGMFSYVPCKPCDSGWPRFARPPVTRRVVNPASRQAPSGAKNFRALNEVHSVWTAVTERLVQDGFSLGCAMPTPRRRSATGQD
jgi:hypothetical protein